MQFKPFFSALLGGVFLATSTEAVQINLPLWKEEAEALGYRLPKPVGLNLSYMTVKQDFAVDSIGFSGLQLPKLIKGIEMKAHNGTQKTDVFTVRADMWVLPFLNVYALAGKVSGDSTTSVDYDVVFNQFPFPKAKFPANKFPIKPESLPNLKPGLKPSKPFPKPNKPIKPSQKPSLPTKGHIDRFSLNLDGHLYGAGFVLAGAYNNIFGLVDASYTRTNLTVIDGEIDAFVVSPRVGYDFNHLNLPLRVWGGAMYQNVEQHLSGNLSDLNLGIKLPQEAKFHVTQHLVTKWNPIIGAQYKLHDNINILGELGLGERRSAFITLDLRY